MSQPDGSHGATSVPGLSGPSRDAGAPETYLVLLRIARVARAAAAALEDLHAAEGRRALALVPPVRGAGFADWALSAAPGDRRQLQAWCAGHLPGGVAPVLLGLEEDGLARRLTRLGLTAYVGVPSHLGALDGGQLTGPAGEQVHLIPVSTARELVRAVVAAARPGPAQAAGTPWVAKATPVPARRLTPARRSRPMTRSVPRHLLPSAPVRAGVAGLAGAVVVAGLAPAAAAAAQTLPSAPPQPRREATVGHWQPGRAGDAVTPAAEAEEVKIAGEARAAEAERAQKAEPGLAARYTVRPGDSLSSIAGRMYHHPAAWPVLYWANHRHIRWANLIVPGQKLRIPPEPAHIPAQPAQLGPAVAVPMVAALAVPYTPRHARPAPAPTQSGPAATGTPQAATTGDGGYPGGAFGACVVTRESGGDPQVMNSTGHYGLYQFSASTWAEYGGNPANFGNASVAEQNRVFATALARGGQDNWTPYDGC